MEQKLVQNFFTARSWSFRKRTAKATPKIEKYVYNTFTENIYFACNPMQVVVFCKHVLILQNNDLNFLALKLA